MKIKFLFYTLLIAGLLSSGCVEKSRPEVEVSKPRNHGKRVQRGRIIQDDLDWLVGRWRCLSREYLPDGRTRSLGTASQDFIEYFNVYLPFADDNLSHTLTDNPEDRQIAAEFLARVVPPFSKSFKEELRPMYPQSVVRISRDRLLVGGPPFVVEFKYRRAMHEDAIPQLILESKHVRIVLEQLSYEGNLVRDLTNSSVIAPVREYSPEYLEELRGRYHELQLQSRKQQHADRSASHQESPNLRPHEISNVSSAVYEAFLPTEADRKRYNDFFGGATNIDGMLDFRLTQIREVIRPDKLQQWSIACIEDARAQTNSPGFWTGVSIRSNSLPAELLQVGGPVGASVVRDGRNTPHVRVAWRSVESFWGLAVADSRFRLEADKLVIKEWQPGIYVWHSE